MILQKHIANALDKIYDKNEGELKWRKIKKGKKETCKSRSIENVS